MVFTTFTNGTTANADEVNANFTETRGLLHTKTFTSATERTGTGDTMADTATTFTLTTDEKAIIIGYEITADLLGSNTGPVYPTAVGLKLTGSNLGTYYLTSVWSSTSSLAIGITSGGTVINTYQNGVFNGNSVFLSLADTSTTLTLMARSGNPSANWAFRNVTLKIYYVNYSTVD
jgi:hypothetical protein